MFLLFVIKKREVFGVIVFVAGIDIEIKAAKNIIKILNIVSEIFDGMEKSQRSTPSFGDERFG